MFLGPLRPAKALRAEGVRGGAAGGQGGHTRASFVCGGKSPVDARIVGRRMTFYQALHLVSYANNTLGSR